MTRPSNKRLTAEEERRLLVKAKNGGEAAKRQLIAAHEGLIQSVVRRFRGYGDRDDLYQAGVVGLLTAINKYDLRRTVRLCTYALPHILGEVRRQASLAQKARGEGWPEDGPELVGQAIDVDERAAVREAIRQLPPLERELVLWRYYLDRSQTETAGELGISQAQVSRLEQAARARLGDFLK